MLQDVGAHVEKVSRVLDRDERPSGAIGDALLNQLARLEHLEKVEIARNCADGTRFVQRIPIPAKGTRAAQQRAERGGAPAVIAPEPV